ncbi:DNA endonuclease [Spirulina subsalsa FACHB-351]|uniref:DNA endonuclease n=2 Tax=Spirulina subsalsa TaxID=54311 RepID=A0ABT3L502_9CYAN|nr:DNA endonuclease [Spirulina subsalsa FACHB-351]
MSHPQSMGKTPTLTKKEQRGVLAGMLLGCAQRNGHNFYVAAYDQRELDYLRFKQDWLERITGQSVPCCPSVNSQGVPYLRLQPPLIPLTRILMQKLYRGSGGKVITPQFLEELTPQGVAIWFLDCGSKTFKKRQGKIHALEVYLNTNLPKSENETIVKYFLENWGVQWGLSSQNKRTGCYRLRIGTKGGQAFLSQLAPYVPSSMLYKINTSYSITATPGTGKLRVKE